MNRINQEKSMFPEMRMGLQAKQPDPAAKDWKPLSFDDMRQAISEGSRDSALINQCLRQAEYMGLSGEDKYVMLAYQALVMLEEYWKRCNQFVALSPNPPPFILKDGTLTG
jgi:hypothetical protein